MLRKRNY